MTAGTKTVSLPMCQTGTENDDEPFRSCHFGTAVIIRSHTFYATVKDAENPF